MTCYKDLEMANECQDGDPVAVSTPEGNFELLQSDAKKHPTEISPLELVTGIILLIMLVVIVYLWGRIAL